MKLNIQKFADGLTFEGIEYKLDDLILVEVSIRKINKNIESAYTEIVSQLEQLVNVNFDKETQDRISTAVNDLKEDKEEYSIQLEKVAGIISAVIEGLKATEFNLSGKWGEWSETFKKLREGLKAGWEGNGATNSVESASAAGTAVGQSIRNSVSIVSDATKKLANETATILANSGGLLKAVTGKSAQDIFKNSVGTIATLANNTGSIITSLFSSLGGKGFANLLQK